jgi:hypothetical protein
MGRGKVVRRATLEEWKRVQKGSLEKVRCMWIARWRQDGERKAEMLGRVSQMTKALASLVAPINNRRSHPSRQTSFGDFYSRSIFAVLAAKVEALNPNDERGSVRKSSHV